MVIRKCSVFANYSHDFIKILVRTLIPSVFAPEDNIIKEGEKSELMYFIKKGKVEIYHERTQTVFKHLHENKHFGEIGFFLNRPRTCSAKSLVFTEILHLSRFSMAQILAKRSEDYEKNKILICQASENLSVLGIKCYLCKKPGHISKNCKDFVIVLSQRELANESNNKRNKLKKKIKMQGTLNDLKKPSFLRYSTQNTFGKETNTIFKNTQNLNKKCAAYLKEGEILIYRDKINVSHYEDHSDSDSDVFKNSLSKNEFLLPNNMQFTKKFKEKRNSVVGNDYSLVSNDIQ